MIRSARPDDVPSLVSLVHELVVYEQAADEVRIVAADLDAALFATTPKVHCLVADADGEVVGMAVWFVTFSTWLGHHGIYLEDLYVRPAHRGQGHGRALLAELAAVCLQRGYVRLELSVLDWNEPAIGFYRRLGAVAMDEWTVHRLTGVPLAALAASPAARTR
ncbi:MAG: N-acetyltransferase family protein [Frankiaceae bacterium]